MLFCQLLFRSCAIVSAFTVPIYSPSSRQVKSSKSSSFLSSKPIAVTIIYLLDIGTTEPFVEIGVLYRDLSAVAFETVIALF